MRNQEHVGINEMNKNANGGTEITTRQLFNLLDPSDLEGVQIISSRVRELDPDKLRIYHLHDLPNDPEASHLREAASRDRFDRIVFSSSAATYGQPVDDPITEESVAAPTNPYGASKLAIDHMITARGISAISLRYFNVAGARRDGKAGQRSRAATHLVKVAAEAACGKRPSVKVFGTDYPTPDGTCIRDYIHIRLIGTQICLSVTKTKV